MITSENYFNPENESKYMGHTQFVNFTRCEAAALASVRGEYIEEKSTALMVGSYVDAYFEGTLDLFKAHNPGIFTKSGSLRAEYAQAEQIIQRIERDSMFMQYMSGEKQKIMTGEICGVPVKIKIDSFLPDKIVDLKIMRSMDDVWVDGSRLEFWDAWGYAIQGAMYREIVRQNTGKTLPFIMAVATKEKPEPNIDLIEISKGRLDSELVNIKGQIERFAAIKNGTEEPERCGECPYCRSVKTLTGVREVG